MGSGFSGLSTAYGLMRRGRSVVVLAETPGPLEGNRGLLGHLSNALENRCVSLEKEHGQAGARRAVYSRAAAVDWIESTAAREKIDCAFERVDGYLFPPPGASPRWLERELAAASRAGLTGAGWTAQPPLFSFDPCLRFPRQAQFRPERFLAGLAAALKKGGARLFSAGRSASIRAGSPALVKTGHGASVECRAVVAAAQSPAYLPALLRPRHALRHGCLIAGRVPRGAVARALYWDGARIRLQGWDEESDLLAADGPAQGGGFAVRCDALERRVRALVPALGFIDLRLPARRLESADGLPFIGRLPGADSNIYASTGDLSGAAADGAVAGLILADLILGRENPWAVLYDPARPSRKAPKPRLRRRPGAEPPARPWHAVDAPEPGAPNQGASSR
jgi:glycine/D-amino acid oxidase-like deaminating enzyme